VSVPAFPIFFEALWGHPPFPWQARLAERVEGEGWPGLLDIPTGLGKTAAIDVAVWHLARQAGARPRRAPVRIVYVVDRRLVVDQATRRAETLAAKLRDAGDGPLAPAAEALRGLAGDGPPLAVVRLRGGMPLDPDWVRTPHQPTVILSTVDQAGSRLLFRGYGVSNRMWPVHAGLLGSDCLYLVDEAHLSQPFLETLGAVARLRRSLAKQDLGLPFALVQLSATAAGTADGRFGLAAEDLANAEIRRRIGASKPARLQQVEDEEDAFAAGCSAEARAFLDAGRRRIGIVVNRVLRARRIHERLRRETAEGVEVLLAIGRVRPLDRERIAGELEARLSADRSAEDGPPVVVIGTQTLEVGADFDLDALVTEIAPLDALRQRFGRLDRRGRLGTASAVILARKCDVAKGEDDPVYGTAAAATWRWLTGLAKKGTDEVDFGIEAFRAHEKEIGDGLLAPRASAPVLLPAHIDALARTSPPPAAQPDPALLLHGPRSGPAEVRIVWRADLAEEDLADGERARAIVTAVPPSSLEALDLPLAAARDWLAGRIADLADVEGSAETAAGTALLARRVLRWRGPDDDGTGPIPPDDIRPGDTLVVPSAYGGCDRFGWNPTAREPVVDLAEEAAERQRGRLVLRLHPALAESWRDPDDPRPAADLWRLVRGEIEALADPDAEELAANLLARPDLPERLRARLERLRTLGLRLDRPYGEDAAAGCVLAGRRRIAAPQAETGGEPVSETDRLSLAAPAPVALADHLDRVGGCSGAFARRVGLPEDLCDAVARAGRLHDLGKAEPRFQILLRGGDRLQSVDTLLAKSHRIGDPARARALAGLPAGIRHESWSVAAVDALLKDEAEALRELVLWLVGTHHGHGRPFFPPVTDEAASDFAIPVNGQEIRIPGDPGLQRLDSFWFELAERLQARFGPWQLAFLEALVRLADHRVSETEAGG
jgi:CRISPR-associated endonuclease/helicase Cas3